MYRVKKGEFGGTSVSLTKKLNAYKKALVKHSKTEGVPAPLPEYEFFFDIMKDDGTFELENIPDMPTETETTLRRLVIIDRFTDDELNIVLALQNGTIEEKRWWLRWVSSVQIDTLDPEVIAGFAALFGQTRATELLNITE